MLILLKKIARMLFCLSVVCNFKAMALGQDPQTLIDIHQNEEFAQHSQDKKIILFTAGWNEEVLKNITFHDPEKQNQDFARYYLWAIKRYQEGRSIKYYHISHSRIPNFYRKYLFQLATGLPQGEELEKAFKEFDTKNFSPVTFAPQENLTELSLVSNQVEFDPIQYLKDGKNKQVFDRIKSLIEGHKKSKGQKIYGLFVDSAGPVMEKFAQEMELPLISSKNEHEGKGKKSATRKQFAELNLPHLPGSYRPQFSVEALADELHKFLIGRLPYPSTVIFRLDNYHGTNGTRTLFFSAKNRSRSRILQKLKKHLDMDFILQLPQHGVIFEELPEREMDIHANTLTLIEEGKEPRFLFSYRKNTKSVDDSQVVLELSSLEGMPHLNKSVQDNIKIFSEKLAKSMAKQGSRGHLNTQLVICNGRPHQELGPEAHMAQFWHPQIFFTEGHLQESSALYPYHLLINLMGKEKLAQTNIKVISMLPMNNVKEKTKKEEAMEKFFEWLNQSPYRYQPESGTGVIIYHQMSNSGKISFIVMKPDASRLDEYAQAFQRDMKNYWETLLTELANK